MKTAAAMVVVLGVLGKAADVSVRVEGGTIQVHAQTAPLATILDRVSAATGIKLVYDGPRPQAVTTVHAEWRTSAEAIRGVLEGSGLNYAFTTDPTGAHVTALVVSGADPAAAGRLPRRAGAAAGMPLAVRDHDEVAPELEEGPDAASTPGRSSEEPALAFPANANAVPSIDAPVIPDNPSSPPLAPEL